MPNLASLEGGKGNITNCCRRSRRCSCSCSCCRFRNGTVLEHGSPNGTRDWLPLIVQVDWSMRGLAVGFEEIHCRAVGIPRLERICTCSNPEEDLCAMVEHHHSLGIEHGWTKVSAGNLCHLQRARSIAQLEKDTLPQLWLRDFITAVACWLDLALASQFFPEVIVDIMRCLGLAIAPGLDILRSSVGRNLLLRVRVCPLPNIDHLARVKDETITLVQGLARTCHLLHSHAILVCLPNLEEVRFVGTFCGVVEACVNTSLHVLDVREKLLELL